jgi:hypothetical protein
MSVVETVERAIASGLLLSELVIVPEQGASPDEIAVEEQLVGRALSEQHKDLLRNWDGLDLDILRIFGCKTGAIPRISVSQAGLPNRKAGSIVIGSDPSGFLYYEDEQGCIWSYDSEGGTTKCLGRDLGDFLGRVVFGRDASLFAGEEWAEAVRTAGLC